MSHPIIQRELIGTLRTARTLLLLAGTTVVFVLLVISRWPSNATVELSGAQAQEVFRLFAYGLLTVLLLLVPAFPATSLVREKMRGTLTLLLNSPMSSTSIFFGKALGMLLFVSLILGLSLPAAAAAYAMGGISFLTQVLPLYGVLFLVLVQYTTVALMVSGYTNSIDAALRVTYAVVLLMAVATLGPHYFLQGKPGLYPQIADTLRCVSPIPVLMELVGHGDIAAVGVTAASPTLPRFVLIAIGSSMVFAMLTVGRLDSFLLDRPRPQGVVTDERSRVQRWMRRMVFLVDPHRRKRGFAST